MSQKVVNSYRLLIKVYVLIVACKLMSNWLNADLTSVEL